MNAALSRSPLTMHERTDDAETPACSPRPPPSPFVFAMAVGGPKKKDCKAAIARANIAEEQGADSIG